MATPVADGGFEGERPFREFMDAYGRSGKAGDGRKVFTGVHRCGQANVKTGYILSVDGYNPESDTFDSDTAAIQVSLRRIDSDELVAAWSFSKLANSWNKKHASAVYVKRDKRPHPGDDTHDYDYLYLSDVFVCEGTNIWRLLRAIHSGMVYYDPAHTIYADNAAKVRPQWRINTARLEESLKQLYREVRIVSL